jgi:hypothetical protein
VRHHHEQWDGRGYPDGLAGSEIPIGARILSVVDCFDALTSDRPYRPRLTDDAAIEILRSRRGTFYDPAIVDKFIELIPLLREEDGTSVERHDGPAPLLSGVAQQPPLTDSNRLASRLPSPITVPLRVRHLIDEAAASVGATACLFVVNDTRDALVAVHATPDFKAHVLNAQISVGTGVSGWVAAHRSTIRCAEPALELGVLAETLSLKSCVSVPVFVRGDAVAVLTVYARWSVSPEEVEDVGMLAQEVGLVMARAAERSMHGKASASAPARS